MKYDIKSMTVVKKGWGQETWIVNNDKYCGKILTFEAGKKFSVHYHKDKDEVFFVRSGKLKLGWKDVDSSMTPQEMMMNLEYITLNAGDAFHIPTYRVHYIYAFEDSEIFEFSTHHEDSDSYRLLKGD